MPIETVTPPKTSFTYEWRCEYPPCSARLRGEEADAIARHIAPHKLGFGCPHCGRRTLVELREP